MNSYKLRLLSISSIALASFLSSSFVQASLNVTDEEKNVVPYQSQNVENKINGILVTFDDFNKNIEESLGKQALFLNQTFAEKVKTEEAKRDNLVTETDSGIKERTKDLRSVKTNIKSQTGSITQEITRIHSFIDTAVGPTILRVLKPRLKLEVSRSITGFTNTLGTPSTYRDENQYKGYYLIKTTELDSMYTSIEQYVKDIRVLCQTLDGVWKKAESISQKISSARGPLYSNSDSVYTTLTKEGGKWYLNLAAKANDADNFISSASSEASKIISDSDSIKSSISTLELNLSALNNKIVQTRESPNTIGAYGDSLIQKVLDKSKTLETTLENNVVSNIHSSLDGYFGTGGEYSSKMESLKRNTDKIEGSIININNTSEEIDTYAGQIESFTATQNQKVKDHHTSLVNKGNEFNQDAKTVIEKNREISLGIMKGKTSEIIMAAKSLGMMISDKHDQVQTYKQQLKDTGETFKSHENVLVAQHGKHVDDVKSGKNELLEEKNKVFSDKQKTVEKLEAKNNQLESDIEKYRQQVSKMSGDSQTVDAMLRSMLMMMGVNPIELNDCNTPMLAQKCFSKYLEVKKF